MGSYECGVRLKLTYKMGHFRLYSQGGIGHTLAAGSEEATQMLIIGLATREVPVQKRTLTPHAPAVRHDPLGIGPRRYALSRERVVFTPGIDGQHVTLLLTICAKTNSE